MKKTTGSYDKNSSSIGFQEWNLEAMEKYQELLKDIVREGFEIATREYQCQAWFAIASGPQPTDPTTICVEIPIGPGEEESPRWSFRLSELVQDMIELNEQGEGGPIDEEERKNIAAVRDDLRKLADKLDAALNRGEGGGQR